MLDIPGYTLNAKLAEGGCAEIYAGIDQATGKLVAIKILHPRHLDNKAEYKRLVDEAALGIKMAQHDNIVQTYKGGNAGGIPFIAMEYVKGVTLRSMVKRKIFTDPEIVKLAKGIARGLRFLHNSGVCHKDLKPDNIMIDEGGIVKLIDFGFAENVNAFKFFGRHLEGSPGYMAPELFATKKPTVATDLYALGCTLYECATGVQPFSGMSDAETISKQTNLKLTPNGVRDQNKNISMATEKMILTAIEKEISRRFKSADEVLLDLTRNPNARDTRNFPKVNA